MLCQNPIQKPQFCVLYFIVKEMLISKIIYKITENTSVVLNPPSPQPHSWRFILLMFQLFLIYANNCKNYLRKIPIISTQYYLECAPCVNFLIVLRTWNNDLLLNLCTKDTELMIITEIIISIVYQAVTLQSRKPLKLLFQQELCRCSETRTEVS